MITKEVIERATAHRRHLHMYPEVSGTEVETTRYIRKALEAMGLKCGIYNQKQESWQKSETGMAQHWPYVPTSTRCRLWNKQV